MEMNQAPKQAFGWKGKSVCASFAKLGKRVVMPAIDELVLSKNLYMRLQAMADTIH